MPDTSNAIPLSGATRVFQILGDPIAQVKSPGGMTASFHVRGRDAIVVPAQIPPERLGEYLDALAYLKNLDGLIVTVPHKFACFAHCAEATERARFLGAVNVMRKTEAGWLGDALDGIGYVTALKNGGARLSGARALLIGAGGAGSAIALSLIEGGARELAVHDPDAARRDSLIARLNGLGKGKVHIGSADAGGFDLVCNASPMGMREGDPLPVEAETIAPSAFVACVITAPAISPLIAAARARGCKTSTGYDMYLAVQALMVDFLLDGREAA